MAARTAGVSVRSGSTVSAPAADRSAAVSLPVATAMIRARLARAAATSFGVSPIRTGVVVEVDAVGSLARDVDEVGAGVVVGAVGTSVEVEIAVKVEGAQFDL